MLKGTMKIELTDVHTGQKETVLEENMVTNALTELFRPLGLLKSAAKWLNTYAPYYQKLLGGILMFDSNIEENAANIYPPANAHMVGCAMYNLQNNTTGTKRGGYNQTESELNLNNRYMKFVYDFATSQANGTIACVCLTHLNGGFTSYGSDDAVRDSNYPLALQVDDGTLQYVYNSYTGATTGDKYSGMMLGTTQILFLIDREADVVYYFRINNSTSIDIIKRRAYLKSVSVLESPYNQKAFIEEFSLPELKTELKTNYYAYNFDYADEALYIFCCGTSTIKAGESFQITKVSLDNWRITQYEMVNTSNVQLTTNGTRFAYVHDGFVYLKTYSSPYDVYKFEVGNAANVAKMEMRGMTSILGHPQMAINGRLYYEYATSSSSSQVLQILNTADNEFLKTETRRIYSSGSSLYCYTPVLHEPMLYYISSGNSSTGGFFTMSNYLATINNLSEPVTKTANKTMKITYIVQEQ